MGKYKNIKSEICFLKKGRIERKGLTSLGIYDKILLKTRVPDEEKKVPEYGGTG